MSAGINYDVPFFSNTPDDTHCVQAALRMVLKYFLPERDFSWEELDKATAKVEGKWTWTMAGLVWMKGLGFMVKDIEDFDYAAFSRAGETYLLETFGEEVGREQIVHTGNLSQEMELARQFVESHLAEKRIPAVEEIIELLRQGYLVTCNVNARTLNSKEGYVGHFIVVKGVTDRSLIVHDPGLPALKNRDVDLALFERAWAYPNDTARNIVAFRLDKSGRPV